MKNYIYILVAAVVFIAACKKKDDKDPDPQPPVSVGDTIKPILTLNGKQQDTVVLQANYSDPGAIAIDNKEGDISAFIVVSGTVNTNLTGDYTKKYDVRDGVGNSAKATRNVHVKNEVNYLEGSYAVACSCSTINAGAPTQTKTVTYTASVVSSATVNGQFNISLLDVGRQGLAPATNLSLNGSAIQGFNPPGTLSGFLSSSKTSFTLNSTSYDQININQIRECTNVFTKQ